MAGELAHMARSDGDEQLAAVLEAAAILAELPPDIEASHRSKASG